jgi:hypothetical protein
MARRKTLGSALLGRGAKAHVQLTKWISIAYDCAEEPETIAGKCFSMVRTQSMNLCIEQMETVPANGEFFRGDDGSLGVGQDVQRGDESWLIEGSTCPIIDRKGTEPGQHIFVSAAYIHGVMDGEMAYRLKHERQRLTLV